MSTSTIPQIIPLPNKRIKDITGLRFGKLTVMGYVGKNHRNLAVWMCKCDCGNVTYPTGNRLITGHTRSCKCSWRENKTTLTHGMSKSPEMKTWRAMMNRCTRQNSKGWKDYGGRGITVCNRWLKFENFFEDMGNRPSDKHSIDRIDNEKGYSPDNCRWATDKQQSNNRRSNKIVTYHGQSHNLTEWSNVLGISYDVLKQRINKLKWTVHDALSTPVRTSKK